jgi:DNA end-binding protein Ku
MRAIWKGFISFGLVTIPVGVGIAQDRSRDVTFRTLSRATLRPVRQKRWDVDRDVEVGPDEVVRGWEVAKGRYVPVEDEELERFAAPREKTIEVLQFVRAEEVDPVYYERAYWVEPQERAERPYALFVAALRRTGRAAIGRFVLATKEHLVLLRPFDGALALETLFYPEDIRMGDLHAIVERLGGVEVRNEELELAVQLVEGLTRPFEPERYPNETRRALLQFLEAKAAGRELVEGPEEEAPVAPVVDLMAALKASLAASGKGTAVPAKGRASGKGRRGVKHQLSIDEARLRGVPGGKPHEAERTAEEAEAGAPAAPPRKRSRKAS